MRALGCKGHGAHAVLPSFPALRSSDLARAVHQPGFGLMLQQAMAPLKIECRLQFPGQPEKANPRALIEFIQAKLAKRK